MQAASQNKSNLRGEDIELLLSVAGQTDNSLETSITELLSYLGTLKRDLAKKKNKPYAFGSAPQLTKQTKSLAASRDFHESNVKFPNNTDKEKKCKNQPVSFLVDISAYNKAKESRYFLDSDSKPILSFDM